MAGARDPRPEPSEFLGLTHPARGGRNVKRRRMGAARGAAPGLVRTLAEAGLAGTWEWDPPSGRFLFDEGAAELMAGDASLAGRPLRSERATAGLEERDVERFLDAVRRAAAEDDTVLVELRPAGLPRPRRILCRGRILRDERGRPIRGEGTLVDAAEVGPEARDLLGLNEDAAGAAIDEAARLLIEARRAIDATGNPHLRDLVDVVLLEVARAIANHAPPTSPVRH